MVDEVVVLLCLGQGLGDFLLQILEDELRAAAHLTGKNQIFAALQMNSLVLADYLFWLFYVTRYFNQLYFKNFLLIKMCHNSLKWQNNVNKKMFVFLLIFCFQVTKYMKNPLTLSLEISSPKSLLSLAT